MTALSLPAPAFEGSEKRLELDFFLGPSSFGQGLRCLTRRQIDSILDRVKLLRTVL